MIKQELIDKFHDLSIEKQILLLKRLEELSVSPLSIPILPSKVKDSQYRLSFAQERLWFLNELEPDVDSYILYRCLRLKGPLSLSSFFKKQY